MHIKHSRPERRGISDFKKRREKWDVIGGNQGDTTARGKVGEGKDIKRVGVLCGKRLVDIQETGGRVLNTLILAEPEATLEKGEAEGEKRKYHEG